MDETKLKFHSRIRDAHLHDVMQTGTKKMEPNANFFVE
jgi:hypothetical protein